jgi:hypothetical protein
MTITKVPQQKITQTIDALRWAVSSDDAEAAAETRKRARQCGPDCVALLHFVVTSDTFASAAQRVRSAGMLLEAGGFLWPGTKETALFHEPEGSNGGDDREGA